MGSIPIPPTLYSDCFEMNDSQILDLYMSQSENVRYLSRVIANIQKDINFYLRKSDDFQVAIKTKILSLVYSAWSEAQFIQIIFTPKGFQHSEICKIKDTRNRYGIAEGWKFMIHLALSKVGDPKTSRDLNGRLNKLLSLIKSYIEEPSILRNKIAHGQWINALNSENTAMNQELSDQLSKLDFVELGKRVDIHQYLGFIVRDLVQSPKAGFHNHYWTNVVNLENYVNKTKNWSIESKRIRLSKKPIKYNT